ncbi:MAG: emp24/gp25L/p24 family protein [Candidatus Bathyarchaeia archaeon]
MKKTTLILLIFALSSTINLAHAPTKNLTIEGKQKTSVPIKLEENDRFAGKVLVSSNLDINFYVVDPTGNIFLNYSQIGDLEFAFSAPMTGQYVFCFDNSESDQIKTVTFNYNIQHYVFGIPQELFLLGVIVIIIMICIIVYVASSKI